MNMRQCYRNALIVAGAVAFAVGFHYAKDYLSTTFSSVIDTGIVTDVRECAGYQDLFASGYRDVTVDSNSVYRIKKNVNFQEGDSVDVFSSDWVYAPFEGVVGARIEKAGGNKGKNAR
jgi:hypothetical protein